MSAYQKQNLEKLCKFIRNINKSFVLYAVSHPCLCCIYCIYVYIYSVFCYMLYVIQLSDRVYNVTLYTLSDS